MYTQIFSDDFNRGDENGNNDDVENDWGEYEQVRNNAKAKAKIFDYELFLDGVNDVSQRPCVWHQFDIPASASEEYVQVNYTYNFAPLPNEEEEENGFHIGMRLGQNMTCTPDINQRVVDLFHTDENKADVSKNGTFGHFFGTNSRSPQGIVNGLVDVSVIVNNINSVFSYNVTGDVFDFDGNPKDIEVKNVPFLNGLVVNSTYIKLDKVQTFATIDDFTVNTFPEVVGDCGITLDDFHNFGSIKPGEISDKVTIEIFGNGDTDSLVTVYGNDWFDLDRLNDEINIINVEYTHFSKEDKIYTSMTELTKISQEIGVVSHHGSQMTYWQTESIVNDTTFHGKVQQSITFVSEC
jgi:hypothetical protein